jgi:ribosome biogenesis GTPase / thiamine phosphate phosphatase
VSESGPIPGENPPCGAPVGCVVAVFRGGCEVVADGARHELRLTGRHAHEELRLAVGDEVSFDAQRAVVLERQERRTCLRRCRPLGRRRNETSREELVIAVNMDRLAIVVAVQAPPPRAGAIDRFMLAASAGGLEAVLVVNKIDLLDGAPLPDALEEYRGQIPMHVVSAHGGIGIAELRTSLAGCRTVLAGHSGVGKSSLLNAIAPGLDVATGELRKRDQRGRHTTTRAIWVELPGAAVLVDTPGVREIATGPVDPELLSSVFPDIDEKTRECRFGDCRHEREPDCAVREAVQSGALAAARVSRYLRLRADVAGPPFPGASGRSGTR